MADLTDPIFTDEAAAREHFEAIRWPNGPTCPKCNQTETVAALGGKSMGPGWYHCRVCREKFTALVGTIYHRSHIPLHKWLLATHLMVSSKKGMSAHQLHRMLGLTYKSAWFMAHRIREAMRELHPEEMGPLGGEGETIEADETYIGGKAANRKGHIPPKEAAFSLVQRQGRVRSHHVATVNAQTLGPILAQQIAPESWIVTDDSPVYPPITKSFAGHSSVNHSAQEYVRGFFHHTNTIENYFSILKRGITGTYHHVSPQHLKRYLGEFDFRYNERMGLGVDDKDRAVKAVRGTVGKRMTYQQPRGRQAASKA
jgi:transposase-like protein